MKIHEFIFALTKGCVSIDTDKVIEHWSDRFYIHQTGDRYMLRKARKKKNDPAININKEDADLIIKELGLLPVRSPRGIDILFHTEIFIASEMKRIKDKISDIESELENLDKKFLNYDNALDEFYSKSEL